MSTPQEHAQVEDGQSNLNLQHIYSVNGAPPRWSSREPTMDELIEMQEQEQDIEELDSLDPFHLEHRMTAEDEKEITHQVDLPVRIHASRHQFKGKRSLKELWFQQDGATCHTARATIDLLKDTFGDRLISRFEPVNWPPKSCDLTPLDYFLWGYVKSLVYADKPQTLDHLEDNIRRVIADIRPQMLKKVIENWTPRLDYIRASRGSSMPEIIFKM
ncbi:heat shock 70kDa protein 8 [Trichonephila clavipes]|nr:heat shock 70kDa protein 8 [Trichonephila clavipes]